MFLKKLKLQDHPALDDLEIDFVGEVTSDCKKTILIGPNGTGKSRVLAAILDVLSIEWSEQAPRLRRECNYIYTMNVKGKKQECKLDNDEGSFGLMDFGNVICITNSINDRFPFLAKNSVRNNHRYKYFGLRTASNNVFMSALRNRILKSILLISSSNKKSVLARGVLRDVGLGGDFAVELSEGKYFKAFKKFYWSMASNDFYPSELKESLIFAQIFKEGDSYGDASFAKFVRSGFLRSIWGTELWDFIGELLVDKKRPILSISLDEKTDHELALYNKVYELIENSVLKVESVRCEEISGAEVSQISSGEFNLMRLLLSLIESIDNHSLILIDEPEVSLHPNWQMELINIIDKVVGAYEGCHTIIATHSHFLLANCSSRDTSVISLGVTENGEVSPIYVDVNSYGWSPEQVLYRVFGLTGYRNKYFEYDLKVIIKALETKDFSGDVFCDALERVSGYDIENNDPVHQILGRVKVLSGHYND